ncbi:2,4'-dihydroxyacetophenone dioxygenase family protein [uncultured Roseovarius sp.]|uniref:2,4'-dihydroxyacetophenone dioxygenase family protein n=1 Tax=uncultured Roseovarius sp. TaxID=293344 RepID=UPI002629929F|nr:2,4'-dihydroxyacetophenone dioxygenase family protein [uncultured Roseovarius sp.]
MPLVSEDENPRVSYKHPMPPDALPDIVVQDALSEGDPRMWVQQTETVFFRPLCLNVSQGYWMNLLKVTKAGVLSRHRHPNPVHGFVLKGRWHYFEHDWEAREGSYVYEPPGETHTLVVPDDVDEMITYFQVNGVMFTSTRTAITLVKRTYSPRSTCAARISKRSAWALITSKPSSGRCHEQRKL